MAVIILEKEEPKACFECDYCFFTLDGFNCEVINKLISENDEKPDWCPVKSVEGLITAIRTEEENITTIRCGKTALTQISRYYRNWAVDIIKKYCEVNENGKTDII